MKSFSSLGVITTPTDEKILSHALENGGSLRCKDCGGYKFVVKGLSVQELVVSFYEAPIVFKELKSEFRATRVLKCANCGSTNIEMVEKA